MGGSAACGLRQRALPFGNLQAFWKRLERKLLILLYFLSRFFSIAIAASRITVPIFMATPILILKLALEDLYRAAV